MHIDTHAHLNFKAFNKDRDKVIENCLAEQVFLVNVGSDYETSLLAVEIAEKYKEGVWASIALHPIHAKDEEFDYEKYKKLAESSKKVVAVGETGLDTLYNNDKQKQVFLEHLRLASELGLPVILHCRGAHQELLETIKQHSNLTGVIHCFTGNWAEAQEYLALGFYLGFNGIIFKHNVDEIIKKMPLDKMVLETDCPYLTPPHFPSKRNTPLGVKYVAEKIAGLRAEPIERIAETTTVNAKKLFSPN